MIDIKQLKKYLKLLLAFCSVRKQKGFFTIYLFESGLLKISTDSGFTQKSSVISVQYDNEKIDICNLPMIHPAAK